MGDKLRKEDYIIYLDEEEDEKARKKGNKKQKEKQKAEKQAAEAAGKQKAARAKAKKKASAKKKKTKKKSHFFSALLIIILILALIAGAVYVLAKKNYIKLPFEIPALGLTAAPAATAKPQYDELDNLFTELENEGNDDGLNESEAGSVRVTGLSVTEGLDEDWLNILLLGTDTRVSYEAARSDTMMICSINQRTGKIKLTSIMRDTAVKINGRTTRINSAYFYGGAELAMKVVNEYFGMNITYYVVVDFNGFAGIAETLGGVEMNVTEAEKNWINHNVMEQYHLLYTQGKMEKQAAYDAYLADQLDTFGSNIHLNGMQTLGYARIRKTDSDYARAERQRAVLNALMIKLKGADATKLMTLAAANAGCYRTNLTLNTIVNLGLLVLDKADFDGAEELRLPINGTYKEEVRNNDAMLYDMDKAENIKQLYKFIYQ